VACPTRTAPRVTTNLPSRLRKTCFFFFLAGNAYSETAGEDTAAACRGGHDWAYATNLALCAGRPRKLRGHFHPAIPKGADSMITGVSYGGEPVWDCARICKALAMCAGQQNAKPAVAPENWRAIVSCASFQEAAERKGIRANAGCGACCFAFARTRGPSPWYDMTAGTYGMAGLH